MVPLLLERLKAVPLLLSDGAWGTQFIQRGLDVNREPADVWNLRHADVVAEIAGDYAKYADILTTNTFGANRIRLERFGLAAELHDINARGVAIARAAERERSHRERPMLIAGAMGPMRGPGQSHPNDETLFDCYQEQASVLAVADASFILLETMSDLAEARIAVRAVKAATSLALVCSYAFQEIEPGRFVTWSGHTMETALAAALESGADIVGANCIPATPTILPLIVSMRHFVGPSAPLWLKPNAGQPRARNSEMVYPSPLSRTPVAPILDALGTGMVGGCCGTTAQEIAMLRQEIDLRTG